MRVLVGFTAAPILPARRTSSLSYEWHDARPPEGGTGCMPKKKMDRLYAEGRIEFTSTGRPVQSVFFISPAYTEFHRVTDLGYPAASRSSWLKVPAEFDDFS